MSYEGAHLSYIEDDTVCIECGKKFCNNQAMKRHMIIHTDHKALHCFHCDKYKTNRKECLRSHCEKKHFMTRDEFEIQYEKCKIEWKIGNRGRPRTRPEGQAKPKKEKDAGEKEKPAKKKVEKKEEPVAKSPHIVIVGKDGKPTTK